MLAQRGGPEFNVFGRNFTFRAPWAIAAAVALGLTAIELAPRGAVNGHVVAWYLNGIAVAVAVLASMFAHEAGHAVMGQHLGRAPERISIYPLGGVSDDFNDPGTPLQETLIAIAGPIASGAIAGLFFISWALVPVHASLARQDLLVLGVVNGVLAGANLLPGFPLDGGRIFRAFVWYLHDDFAAGTKASVTYGQVIGTFALASGLVFLGSRSSVSLVGIWIMLAAWGVMRAGRQEMTRSVLLSFGASMTAGAAVRGLNPHVRADQPIDEVLEALLLEMRSGPALVTQDGTVVGVLSLHDMRRYRRSDWPQTRAREAMIPVSQLSKFDASVSVRKLLNELMERRSDTLLVTDETGVIGAVNRQVAVEKLVDRLQSLKFDR